MMSERTQHTYTAAAMIDPGSGRINLHLARSHGPDESLVVEVADDSVCFTRSLRYTAIEEDEDDGILPASQPTVTLGHEEAEAIYTALGHVLGKHDPSMKATEAPR